MGTPDYVAPEQVKGKRGDARTDIYALGVILYEMLTGETPFEGESPLVVLNNRLRKDPVPPRRHNRALSPELEQVILRALEREPVHRYASAKQFEAVLSPPHTYARARPTAAACAPNAARLFRSGDDSNPDFRSVALRSGTPVRAVIGHKLFSLCQLPHAASTQFTPCDTTVLELT